VALKGNRTQTGGALRAQHAMFLGAVVLVAAACSGGANSRGRPLAPEETNAAVDSPIASLTPAVPTVTPTPPLEARDALATAANLLRDGRYEEAAAGYEAVVSRASDPDVRATAALGAGVARFQAGDRDGSVSMLQEAAALAPNGTAAHRRSTYLLGLRLNEASRFQEAVAALQPETENGRADALQPYLLLVYAEALGGANDGRGADAWARLASLPGLTPNLLATMYRERARLARLAGDDGELARWLGRLVSQGGAPADRLELATVAKSQGDISTFTAQLRAIIAGSPAAAQAPVALQLLRDAGIAVDPGQEGLVLYRRGQFDAARKVLEPAASEPGLAPEARAFRSYYLGAAYEDLGRANDAVRAYDAVASSGAASPFVHRAKYWAARVVEGTGDAGSAAQRYLELAATGPAGEFSTEAAFRAGYTLFRAGNAAGAVAAWDRLGVRGDARALYWKGRAEEMLGDSVAATAAYGAAYGADPMGFYGVEAGRRTGQVALLQVGYEKRDLGRPVDWDRLATWLSAVTPGTWPGNAATAAGDLLGVGLREEAATVIYDEADGASPWRLLELAREARGLGMVDVGARLAVRLQAATGVAWATAPGDLLRLAYPVDYVALVEAEARANNVDPLFFAALIRQESFWDAAAGSSAGALGLTQVIPPTGESIAASLGLREFRAGDLFRPSVSLRFGAFYFGGQLQRYRSPYLALAAYNAGPGNATRWADRAGRDAAGPDVVEVVDINETSDYVEKIMDHYAHYLFAYGP